jgi:hypothetical protein
VSVTGPDAALPRAQGAASRWPAILRWLRRWGISVASLVGGLLTLFVFRREVPHVSWIVGYLLILWLLFALLSQIRSSFLASEKRSRRLVVTAVDYTIQTLYHGIMLFLLPPYFASTTVSSVNVLFFALLVVLAVLATFDPWYSAVVHPRPWFHTVYFLVATFGALNMALPLVGVPTHLALIASAWLAVVALAPVICRAGGWGWRRGLGVTASAAMLAAVLAYTGSAVIPPAPLSLVRGTIAWDTGGVESLEPVSGAVPVEEMRTRGLLAYTAISAPAGLTQQVRHVWRHGGHVVSVIDLAPVRGGRREGFRTWSRKTAFPSDAVGRWSVDVATASGQLIGRLSFKVVP